MEKTLGGERLGAGKKQKIHLHNYERSTHDLSYVWRSSMSPGTVIPFMSRVALPGDTFDINLHCDVKTHPAVGPLFGSFKTQLDVFVAPIRLYNAMLHNNALGVGLKISDVLLPRIMFEAYPIPADPDLVDNCQVNPSSLLAYLGIRGIGNPVNTLQNRDFNALPILAYWDIYKNYYANKQEEIGAVIHTPGIVIIDTITSVNRRRTGVNTVIPEYPTVGTVDLQTADLIRIIYSGTPPIPSQVLINTVEEGLKTADELSTGVWTDSGTYLESPYRGTFWGTMISQYWEFIEPDLNQKPIVATFDLANIDTMREAILARGRSQFTINNQTPTLEPYAWLYSTNGGVPSIQNSQEGLALKTYQSDLFNNWIQTEWIDGVGGINDITSIDTTGGSFTIDTLNLANKVYNMLNRIAVSGGSYDDWIDAVYTHDRYKRCETPMYMGGLSKELIFQEVVSNSESGTQPLGTLAGRGVMSGKHKGGNIVISVDEPSYIIGIISLTPRIDYSQGNNWDVNLQTLDDLHKPALDEIGFQELITEQLAWWDTQITSDTTKTFKSAGKQPAWINYMTDINRTYGNFAIPNNEMFMTLNRRYEYDYTTESIKDLTTYIDPSKFNFIFADTAIDAQNFWAQIGVNITARRKMSAKLMPNL